MGFRMLLFYYYYLCSLLPVIVRGFRSGTWVCCYYWYRIVVVLPICLMLMCTWSFMVLTFRYGLDIRLCSCRNSRNREEYLSQTRYIFLFRLWRKQVSHSISDCFVNWNCGDHNIHVIQKMKQGLSLLKSLMLYLLTWMTLFSFGFVLLNCTHTSLNCTSFDWLRCFIIRSSSQYMTHHSTTHMFPYFHIYSTMIFINTIIDSPNTLQLRQLHLVSHLHPPRMFHPCILHSQDIPTITTRGIQCSTQTEYCRLLSSHLCHDTHDDLFLRLWIHCLGIGS